jgi:hypothetical protein
MRYHKLLSFKNYFFFLRLFRLLPRRTYAHEQFSGKVLRPQREQQQYLALVFQNHNVPRQSGSTSILLNGKAMSLLARLCIHLRNEAGINSNWQFKNLSDSKQTHISSIYVDN